MDIISIGIDQGLANIGYGVIKITLDENNIEQDIKWLESGTLTTSSLDELPLRLVKIYDMITALTLKYNANVIGCEKLFFNPIQGGGRNKSASIMNTNMVSGLIFLVAGQSKIFAKDFTPGSVKKYMAGSGRASKEEVITAVEDFCSKQDVITKTDHESDSIAICITTARYYINNRLPLIIAVNAVANAITQEDINTAIILTNSLPTGKDKELLLKKIEKFNKALLKNNVANAKTQDEINFVIHLVNELPDGKDKIALLRKIDKIIKDNNKDKNTTKRKRKSKEGEV